ncbi:WD domain, G-beta repeat-containing protein [Besnoitia besnoiti]|uniref:WD domain, G-beta repeat-containing protein n=1 Tax=Besnoitia besnoiti TaxID=94643 RepID=A0A2A9M6L8_BESBE|nr:WD domain, G-beta repeat-containing protein [Besnoitia besnoiti]PFH33599.1 WD domain, G-beta repeat-containing protein [Besnoitia besnoiti]
MTSVASLPDCSPEAAVRRASPLDLQPASSPSSCSSLPVSAAASACVSVSPSTRRRFSAACLCASEPEDRFIAPPSLSLLHRLRATLSHPSLSAPLVASRENGPSVTDSPSSPAQQAPLPATSAPGFSAGGREVKREEKGERRRQEPSVKLDLQRRQAHAAYRRLLCSSLFPSLCSEVQTRGGLPGDEGGCTSLRGKTARTGPEGAGPRGCKAKRRAAEDRPEHFPAPSPLLTSPLSQSPRSRRRRRQMRTASPSSLSAADVRKRFRLLEVAPASRADSPIASDENCLLSVPPAVLRGADGDGEGPGSLATAHGATWRGVDDEQDDFWRTWEEEEESEEEADRPGGAAASGPQRPYRTLPAPDLLDDFYLNLVDWSRDNVLAVALKLKLFLWSPRAGRFADGRQSHLLFNASGASSSPSAAGDAREDGVVCVKFSPQFPSLLLVGFRSGLAELWDIQAEKKLRTLRGHASRATVAAWSPTQLTVATGARDQKILVRDLRVARPYVSCLVGHGSELCGLDVSPSETLLASGGNDNLLCVWDYRALPCAVPSTAASVFSRGGGVDAGALPSAFFRGSAAGRCTRNHYLSVGRFEDAASRSAGGAQFFLPAASAAAAHGRAAERERGRRGLFASPLPSLFRGARDPLLLDGLGSAGCPRTSSLFRGQGDAAPAHLASSSAWSADRGGAGRWRERDERGEESGGRDAARHASDQGFSHLFFSPLLPASESAAGAAALWPGDSVVVAYPDRPQSLSLSVVESAFLDSAGDVAFGGGAQTASLSSSPPLAFPLTGDGRGRREEGEADERVARDRRRGERTILRTPPVLDHLQSVSNSRRSSSSSYSSRFPSAAAQEATTHAARLLPERARRLFGAALRGLDGLYAAGFAEAQDEEALSFSHSSRVLFSAATRRSAGVPAGGRAPHSGLGLGFAHPAVSGSDAGPFRPGAQRGAAGLGPERGGPSGGRAGGGGALFRDSAARTKPPPSAKEKARDKGRSTPLFTYQEHSAAVKAVAWSPHATGLLASGGGTADRHVRFWNTSLATTSSVYRFDVGCQVCNLCFSPHSEELLSTHGFSLNQVFIWDYSPRLLSSCSAPSSAPFLSSSLASVSDAALISAFSSSPAAAAVEHPMRKRATLSGHTARVLFVAVSPCGRRAVTGAGRGDESLKFWRVFEGDSRASGDNARLPRDAGTMRAQGSALWRLRGSGRLRRRERADENESCDTDGDDDAREDATGFGAWR